MNLLFTKYVITSMRKIILIAALLFAVMNSFCQSQTDLNTFNRQRNKITKNAMIVLGSWSAVNLIYSGIATGQTHGTNLYFHQMNVMWGGINLGLAALSYIGLKNKDGMSLVQSLKQQAGVEKTYMLNAGLDVAYIASGLYLKEKGKTCTKNAQKFKGYGESIILQGAALLLLDGVMFTVHNLHGKKLYRMMEKTQVGVTGNGIGMIVHL